MGDRGELKAPLGTVTVEDDPQWRSAYGSQRDSKGRALYSAVVTLTLGVLGSTILPVPYAFSKIGILVGTLTMAAVAAVNDTTCCMLIRAAALTGCYSYEELAEWAGGRRTKLFTQVSLILLLFGTMCGGLAFLSDVARIMVQKGLPHEALPLLQQDGRPVMVAVALLVLLPLCLQRHIRQFEKAATVGIVVVATLCVIIIFKAVWLGFPGVRSGELPVWSLKVDAHLPEAFSVLGFAFYMQPMLMPLVREMPRGAVGVVVSERAVHIVLYGVACVVYGTVGVFGAACYGEATESNIMVNEILQSPTGTLVLYASLIVYLCCGMVTTHYALRASVDVLLVGHNAPWALGRHVTETLVLIGAAMCVALTFPTQAEKIFAFTGCTAVCLACYLIPVYIHLKLESRLRRVSWADLASKGSRQQAGGSTAVAAAASAGAAASPASLATSAAAASDGSACHSAGSAASPFLLSITDTATGHGASLLDEPPPLLRALLPHAASAADDDGDHDGDGDGGAAALFAAAADRAQQHASRMWLLQPAAILLVGVGFSAAGLYVAAVDFLDTYGWGGVGSGGGGSVRMSDMPLQST